MGKQSKITIWISKTALLIALLLILQFATASLGQYVTGSCVNFILAMSVFVGGFASSIVVAIVSPIFAVLLGIGPAFLVLTPCIMVGNFVFVLVLIFLWAKYVYRQDSLVPAFLAVFAAALTKFMFLYVLVVKIAMPTLGLPDEKFQVVAAMFNFPQLITAAIGGILATIVAIRISSSALKEYFNGNK